MTFRVIIPVAIEVTRGSIGLLCVSGPSKRVATRPKADTEQGETMKALKRRAGDQRRVLIVDDHPMICQGLHDLLENESGFTPCGQVMTYGDALAFLSTDLPDVMMVDLSLEDGSGLDLIKQARSLYPALIILVYSMHDETLYAPRALKAGANGYVEKQSDAKHLIEALQHVSAGKLHVSEDMTEKLLQQKLDTGAPADAVVVDQLTDRELQVFEMLGHGQTTREIADKLNISMKTADRHCENIKLKLQLANRTQLLHHAVHWLLQQS